MISTIRQFPTAALVSTAALAVALLGRPAYAETIKIGVNEPTD